MHRTGAHMPGTARGSLLTLLALAAGLLASGAPAPARAADATDEAPFARLLEGVRPSTGVDLGGLALVALRVPTSHQAPRDAHVGLHGTDAEVLALPGPAGRWHVRIANREDRPLLLPAGTALLTPQGPSRCVDRAVWIAPQTATFVPVVQVPTDPPEGPYLARGRGLTPLELGGLHQATWDDRVRRRNQLAGVTPHRLDDAAAAYTTPFFEEAAARHRTRLATLADGVSICGVAVADDRGVVFVHLEADARRFAALWPRLLAGIVLDDAVERDAGRDATSLREVRQALDDLLAVPLDEGISRPTFGRGRAWRWPLPSADGRWDGLALDATPVALTLVRTPPRAAPAPTLPPPPGPGGGDAQGDPTPGFFESGRRPRETPFEERLRERREPRGGGAGGPGGTDPRPPVTPPPAPSTGGATPRTPEPPRAPAPRR